MPSPPYMPGARNTPSRERCLPQTPVYLAASVTVRPGAQASPNPLALKAPDAYPIVIHEIAMGFRIASGASVPSVSVNNLGVQFSLGSYKITNSFVPLGLFHDREAAVTVGTGVDQQGSFALWRLSQPLFVPQGAILLPTFKHMGQSQNNITAYVQYGVAVAERPDPIIHIPYVSSWTGKVLDFDSADTDESAESDLVNDGTDDLVLDRLVGSIDFVDPDSAYTVEHDNGYGEAAPTSGQITQLKIRDSDDRAVIDQFIVWDSVFPYGSRVFNVGGVRLAPRKYLKVYVNKLVPGSLSDGVKIQPHVAMFGHREVRGR